MVQRTISSDERAELGRGAGRKTPASSLISVPPQRCRQVEIFGISQGFPVAVGTWDA
jgi:hypothetical protein